MKMTNVYFIVVLIVIVLYFFVKYVTIRSVEPVSRLIARVGSEINRGLR